MKTRRQWKRPRDGDIRAAIMGQHAAAERDKDAAGELNAEETLDAAGVVEDPRQVRYLRLAQLQRAERVF